MKGKKIELIDEAIEILKDAERDFRLKPDTNIHNDTGLCSYIFYHRTMKSYSHKDRTKCADLIFGEKDYGKHLFTERVGQFMAWKDRIRGYDDERAEWCFMRSAELEKEKS